MTSKQIKALSFEEATTAYADSKVTAKNERESLNAFCKENKLKRNVDHTDDAKHGKKYAKLKQTVDAACELRDALKEQVKETKPKKTSGRASKYEYPEDITTNEQKKKYRTQLRAAAAKADKAANPDAAASKKKKPKVKAEEAPSEAVATKKKGKKKKAVVAADED